MSEPTTRVVVIHRQTPEGWRSVAPDLKDFKREAETLERVQQLAEDGVRWALNTDKVEVQHEVRESPVDEPQENQAERERDQQKDETREAIDHHHAGESGGQNV